MAAPTLIRSPASIYATGAERGAHRTVRPAARQFIVLGLLLLSVLTLFVAAETGQRQLAAASRRVEKAAHREQAIGDVQEIVSRAESGQRGYILLGDNTYLSSYQDGVERLPGALQAMAAQFSDADSGTRANIAEFARLVRLRFGELSASLDLYRDRGRSAAIALIRTDFGQQTMGQISRLAGRLDAAETADMLDASRSWRTDRWLNLGILVAIATATFFLVLWSARLVLSYVRSKEREASEFAEREARLESMVANRTRDLSELSTQLQTVAEKEKAALSRELHDELGGLLVAARMDVSWLEEKLPTDDPEVRAHFQRVHAALEAGVELKRRVVESLRPTLLDNLGLFAALRWQVSDTCGRGGLSRVEHYPSGEISFVPEASIAIFRIVQESLTNVLKHAQARSVEVHVSCEDAWLLISIKDDGRGISEDRRRTPRSHGLAAMRHRATRFGGECQVVRRPVGGTEVRVRLPLQHVLTSAPTA